VSKLKTSFGQRLKELRKAKNLTQERLAELLEVSVESVSNMERGIYAPSFETLEKLSAALNVPVKELFNFKTKG
jgi:transcriptional regulator with XRE-family HTH domain